MKERLLNLWNWRHDRTIHLVDAFELSPEYFSHMVSRFFSKQSFHRRGSQVPVVITENSVFGDLNTLVKVAANHLGFSPNLQSTYSVSYIATVTEKGEKIARLGSPLHQMIRKVSEYASRRSTVLADDIRKMDKYYGGSFLMKARRNKYLELRESKGNSNNQKFDYYVIRKPFQEDDELQETMQKVIQGEGKCTLEEIKKICGMDWVLIEWVVEGEFEHTGNRSIPRFRLQIYR